MLRGYQNAVRVFCSYLTDPAYGWADECEKRFGPTRCRWSTGGRPVSWPVLWP